MSSIQDSCESETLLMDNLNKCRCCFRLLIDDRRSVKITEEIRSQFHHLTQIELLVSEIFADRICQLCASDLKVFSNLREDLISKQESLYQLAGIDYNYNGSAEAAIEFVREENSDYEDNFENIQEPFFREEETENSPEQEEDNLEDEAYIEESTASEAFLKIEKVDEKSTGDMKQEIENDESCVSLGLQLEEIIATESSDQNYTDIEMKDPFSKVTCDICDIELSKSHFQQHINIMHKQFTCKTCNESFESRILMKHHVNEVHSKDNGTASRSKKRHFCPLCPKDYDYRKQLEDHIRSYHDKERNSQCHICLKTFYHRDLKKHIIHVHGDRNVTCETCGKKYTCVENLRLHMRYHYPPAFACSKCDKKFHQKVLLEHHEKKHSDIKPYMCEECSSAFHSVRDLRRHFQRVHEKVIRKCFLCDIQFSRKDKYRVHLIKKHTELSEDERMELLETIRKMKWNET